MKALEYITQGKCRCNTEGRIVLLSGAWIPHDISGNTFQERVDKYHRRNPNQLTNAQLMYGVMSQAVTETVQPVVATHHTHLNLFKPDAVPCRALSAPEQITSLECELYQLHNWWFEPAQRPVT